MDINCMTVEFIICIVIQQTSFIIFTLHRLSFLLHHHHHYSCIIIIIIIINIIIIIISWWGVVKHSFIHSSASSSCYYCYYYYYYYYYYYFLLRRDFVKHSLKVFEFQMRLLVCGFFVGVFCLFVGVFFVCFLFVCFVGFFYGGGGIVGFFVCMYVAVSLLLFAFCFLQILFSVI